MALTLTVQRGHTFQDDVPFSADDLNAAALPVVVLDGTIGAADIGAGSINQTHTVPGPHFFARSTGGSNAYSITLNPSPTSLALGLWGCFQASFTNTGAATLNVSGFGSKPIVTPALEALSGGEIVADQMVWVQYDGTRWQMVSVRSLPKSLYGVDVGAANACVLAIPGVIVSSLAQLTGQEIIFKAAASNTGATTLAVNGLPAVAITKQGATALSANDIQTGGLVSVAYDGTRFQVTSFVAAPALPSVGAAGTLLYPYSLTVDAQGRVTAASSGVYSAAVALPAKGAAATFTHGLTRTPAFVNVILVAGGSPENGFTTGDEVDVGAIFADVSGGDNNVPIFGVSRNATTINVSRLNETEYMTNKSGSSGFQAFDGTKWTLKVYAW